MIVKRKQEHSRKPLEAYNLIEECSPGPYLELFARERVEGWTQWGDQVDSYAHNQPHYPAYHGQGRRGTTPILKRSTL